jgi:hypothetical protein
VAKIVEVPGVGNVEFPDSMSDDAIGAALAKPSPDGRMSDASAAQARQAIGGTVEQLKGLDQKEKAQAMAEMKQAAAAPGEALQDAAGGVSSLFSFLHPAQAVLGAGASYLDDALGKNEHHPNIMDEGGLGRRSAGDRWRDSMADIRDQVEGARKRSPIAFTAGSILPAVVAPQAIAASMPFSGAVQGAGALPTLARGAGGVLDSALYGAANAAGANADKDPLGAAGEAASSPANLLPAAIPLAQVAGQGISKAVPTELSDWLRQKAGNRILKQIGAIQSDLTRARRQVGRDALSEIGAQMGDLGIAKPLDTSHSVYERASDVIDSAGNKMGQLIKQGDAALAATPGAAPTLGGVVTRARQDILAPLAADPHQADAAAKFSKLLDRYEGQSSAPGWQNMSLSDLHQARVNASKDLYGNRGNQDPDANAYKEALHSFRSMLSDEIDQAMTRSGQDTAPWKQANRQYEVASRAQEFADKGMDRAHGNNLLSPMEALSGMTGILSGSMGHGGLGIGAITGTGLSMFGRRYGSGVLGSGALQASNALRPGPQVPIPASSPQSRSIVQALAAALRGESQRNDQ